jgi:transcriptional regulator with XRE-family HTH domain
MPDDLHIRLYRLLGDRICRARQALKLSQAKLARAVGLNRVSIVNIEKGRQRPSLHVLWEIGRALGVEPSSLIPKERDLDELDSGVHLDADTVTKIQDATKGDPLATRRLTDFIRMAQSRDTENK